MGELGWLDILKSAGSILQAGATAWTGKETNKLQKEVLNYQKEQDKLDENRLNQTQANLDTAVANVYGTEEKKKKGCCFRAVCNFRSDLLVRYQSGDQQFSCFFF